MKSWHRYLQGLTVCLSSKSHPNPPTKILQQLSSSNLIVIQKPCVMQNKSSQFNLSFFIAPICSRISPVKDSGDGKLVCELRHSKDVMLPVTPSFTWHMKEECLEIQLWLSNRRHDADSNSRKRDRLLGSAFVDVSSLLVSQQRKYRQIRCEPNYYGNVSLHVCSFFHTTTYHYIGCCPFESLPLMLKYLEVFVIL